MSNCSSCCDPENGLKIKEKESYSSFNYKTLINAIPLIFSFTIFSIGLIIQYILKYDWFTGNKSIEFIWFSIAYLPVALPVLSTAIKMIRKGDFFNEFSLMSIATIGGFLIGEFSEGVAVMIFYTTGELFQEAAVNNAKRSIKKLLDIRPKIASVYRDGQLIEINPENININEIVQVKVGDKIPLDGELLTEKGRFNTAALTGESKPVSYKRGETILTGMINLENVIEIKATKLYKDSSFAKILELIQDANSRKSSTELFIRKFAKIYTPIVFSLAVAITIIPLIFVNPYIFTDWFYRALIFLVISCPCALVISVPLGYFGGIGAASKHGILFKGSDYLESIRKIKTIAMDKTGTLTEGMFETQKIHTTIDKDYFLHVISAIESTSKHPIANAITKSYASKLIAENVIEIPGKGLSGIVDQSNVLVGNTALLAHYNIAYHPLVPLYHLVQQIFLKPLFCFIYYTTIILTSIIPFLTYLKK